MRRVCVYKCALSKYENENYKEKDEDEISAKYKVIREIAADGLQVISIIQRWGLDEKTAFEVESAVIDCYAGLTNIQNGHDGDRGITNAEALNQVLSATPYNDDNDIDYLIIKTSQNRMSEVGLYEATRSCWKVDPKRLENKYVLAVVNGIVKEVYKPTSWYKVEGTNRYAFNGEVAEKEVCNVLLSIVSRKSIRQRAWRTRRYTRKRTKIALQDALTVIIWHVR